MNLTLQLTDDQVERLAADILKMHKPDALTAPLPGLPSEPALPEPPEGFHKAMMGPIKGASTKSIKGVALWTQGEWDTADWGGSMKGRIYALRIGSEIARLNGLEPESIPADKEPELACANCAGRLSEDQVVCCSPECILELVDKKRGIQPEPVKRREWDASVSCGGSFLGSLGEYQESIRVREVLTGDPTMEEVAALVRAAEFALNHASSNGFDKTALACALKPFTGKDNP